MRKSKLSDPLKKQVKKITIYHDVFKNNVSGKAVLKDMMKVHNFMRSSYIPNDPHGTSFNEGERNVILRILTQLNMDPQELVKLIEEANRDE